MADDRETTARKIRLLDNDNQKYLQQMQTQINKNAEIITNLRKENDKAKHDLAASSASGYKLADQERSMDKQHENEALQQKFDFEKMRQADLDRKLEVLRMEMLQARRTMGGVNVTSDNTQLVEKQVRVLENRLDQALVQFNEALAYNRDLRLQIDNLRGERKVFNDIYKKLEGELHEKKRLMADVIERSNHDYEEHEALKQQLEALKAAAAEDAEKFEENFQKIEDLAQKNKAAQHQQQQQALQQAALKQQMALSNRERQDATQNDKSKGANNASTKGAASAANTSAAGESLNGTLTNPDGDIQEVVDRLKEATGVQDLEVLYHNFVKAEEHNFSMYNFVNELNSEVEGLEAEIAQLNEQLNNEKGDAQRRTLLKSLENDLAAAEEKHHATEEKTLTYREHLDAIRKLSKDIFDKIGASTEMADEQLGTHDCTESNVAAFLGIVEHRANELLYAYNLSTASDQRRRQVVAQEEARKRRERRQAEKQARAEAGEAVNDDDEANGEDDEGDDAGDDKDHTDAHPRAKFVGVGPATAAGSVSAASLVKEYALPTTNSGDAASGAGGDGGAEDLLIDEDAIIDHAALRRDMEERLRVKREKEDRNRKPRRGGKKQ